MRSLSRCGTLKWWLSEGVALSGVIVVDDNRSFAEVARGLLERQGERVLGIASTCAEALELTAALRPDVVLVDIALGAECGLDLAHLLTDDDGGKAPVVIMISAAYSQCDAAELIAASPAAGFLPKSDLSADAIQQILVGIGRIPASSR
jgi:CheY-like chemotaxis protein